MTCKSSIMLKKLSIIFVESILSVEQERKNLVYNSTLFYLGGDESVESF